MECIHMNHFELSNIMRMLWEQHVFWTRLLIISILEDLKDRNATQIRLLRNPKDIGEVYKQFYGVDVEKIITDLLTEHLVIGAELIQASKDRQQKEIQRLNQEWYENADQMAKAFASINPYYNETELKSMLYTHLDLTKNEVALRLQGQYEKDTMNFDRLEQEALMMADYLTCGIVCQFHPLLSCQMY